MVAVKVVRRFRERYRLTPAGCVVVFLVGANVGLLAFISKPDHGIEPTSLEELLTRASNITKEASTAALIEDLISLHCVVVRSENTADAVRDEKEARMTADWFLFVSRRSFVIAENARLFLLPFLEEKDGALVFGSETDYGALPCLLISGGALQRLTTGLEQAPSCGQLSSIGPAPLVRCMSEFGIAIWETRDHLRRHRILPLPPSELRDPAAVSKYSLDGLLHPIMPGLQCCAPTAFAILNLNPRFYSTIHYFISIVHAEGSETDYRVLSKEAKLSEALLEAIKGIPPTFLIE